MIITKAWAMPSAWTFTIRPIKWLLRRYVDDGKGWIDPFAGSGSTGVAATLEGFNSVLIEIEVGSANIARARNGVAPIDCPDCPFGPMDMGLEEIQRKYLGGCDDEA